MDPSMTRDVPMASVAPRATTRRNATTGKYQEMARAAAMFASKCFSFTLPNVSSAGRLSIDRRT